MNQETPDTTADYERIDSYLNEALRDLAFAKGQESGSSYEMANLQNALRALKNAVATLSRDVTPED